MSYRINVFTSKPDLIRGTINKLPFGPSGTTYFEFDGIDTMKLYINDVLIDQWVAQLGAILTEGGDWITTEDGTRITTE